MAMSLGIQLLNVKIATIAVVFGADAIKLDGYM